MTPKLLLLDMEGPLTPTDFASELFGVVVPTGKPLFAALSEYDDILALEECRIGYEPGDTLALVWPFLVSHGLTRTTVEEVVEQTAHLMTGAQEAIDQLSELFTGMGVISTAYEPFARNVTGRLGFTPIQVACTELPLERLQDAMSPTVRHAVLEIERQLSEKLASNHDEGGFGAQALVRELDIIFDQRLPALGVPRPIELVVPRGGSRKVDAIWEACCRVDVSPRDVAYVGDSITDVAAFRFVDSAGGLAVSFNGNGFAVDHATVAVAGRSLECIMPVVAAWVSGGRGAVRGLAETEGCEVEWLGDASAERRAEVAARHLVTRRSVRDDAGRLG